MTTFTWEWHWDCVDVSDVGQGREGGQGKAQWVLMEQVACRPPRDGDGQEGAVEFSADSG